MIRVIFLKKIQGRLGTNGQQIICHPATRAQIIHCDDTVAQQRAGGGGISGTEHPHVVGHPDRGGSN